MTSPFLEPDLKWYEGQVGNALPLLKAQPDPLSKGPPWTIGWGHTGLLVYDGLEITTAQAQTFLDQDTLEFETGLDHAIPWWRELPDLRQDCMVNMAFNLGVHGLCGFNEFLHFLATGQVAEACLDLRGTAWYHQVHWRATHVEWQLRNNAHADPTKPVPAIGVN